ALGDLYETRGSILTTSIFVFAATSPVAGYVGAGHYAQHGGVEWITQLVLTSLLIPGTGRPPPMSWGVPHPRSHYPLTFPSSFSVRSGDSESGGQLCGRLLRRDARYSPAHHGGRAGHPALRHHAPDLGRHRAGPQSERPARPPLPHQPRAAAHPGKEMV